MENEWVETNGQRPDLAKLTKIIPGVRTRSGQIVDAICGERDIDVVSWNIWEFFRLATPAEAERGNPSQHSTQQELRGGIPNRYSEGHAAGFAEGKKLRDCLKYAIELLEEAHSGYISGTWPDMQWDKMRDETVIEAKELLQPKDGGR